MKNVPGLLIALLSALLVLAVFGPAAPGMHENLLGIEYVDHYGTQWFYWFVEHQLETGQGMGHTDLYFHPWGKDIFLHTGANVLDGYLALPFRRVLGPTLGYNAVILLGLASAGVAFWFLARDYTDDRRVALLSSVLFALSPFVLFELVEGRPTQAVLTFPVLFVLFVLRTGRRSGLLSPVLAGLFLAVTGYQYWFYAFFGGMVCLAHGLVRFWRPPEDAGSRWRQLGRHTLIAAVALLLTAPVGLPLITLAAESGNVPGLLDVDRWGLFASPPITQEDQTIGLFLWQPLRRFAGFYVIEAGPQERLLAQAILIPLTSLLAFAALLVRPRDLPRGPLVAMMIMAALIAMGPIFIVHKTVLPNPFFVWLVKSVGFLQRLWWPARASAYLAILLGLANLALLGWAAGRKHLKLVVPALVTVLWGVELHLADVLPFPSWSAAIPAGYRCLAHGPAGAIMELPYSWTQAHLYYQTAHARPIMGGMLENNVVFTPDEFTELCDENEFVSQLFAAAKLARVEPDWPEEDAQEVYDLGYRYVVAQKDAFYFSGSAPGMVDNVLRLRMRNLRKLLNRSLGRPVYEDARVAIYSPWGEPSPCEPGVHVEPDTVTLGLTEVSADQRVLRTPDAQLIHRPWIDRAAYVLTVEGEEYEQVSTQVIPGREGSGAPEGAPEGGSPDLPPALPPPLDEAPSQGLRIPDLEPR
jgi:hypothetical protein